jgi:hypothetical protein
MAHKKSSQSVNRMIGLETIAGISMAIVLIIGVLFFLINGTLNTWPLILCSLMSIWIFAYSGYTSWDFIQKMKKINLLENSIDESKVNFLNFNKALKFYKNLGLFTILPKYLFIKTYSGISRMLNLSYLK